MNRAFQKLAVEGRILHSDVGVAVGQLGPLCVVIWRDQVTAARFELQRAGLAEVVRDQPSGVGFLCIIESDTKPPNDTLRRASMEMLVSHGKQLKCTVALIEGEGFWAAITRSVISSILLLSSHKVPITVSSDIVAALKWMQEYVPVGSIEMAVKFVETVRKHLDDAKAARIH